MHTDLLSLRSLFASVGCIHLATAALATLVALQIAESGQSQHAASFIAASYSMGFLIGCFYIFKPLRRIGHIRAFTAAAALCSICALLLWGSDAFLVMVLSRFATGVATAGLYSVGDAWINDTAAPSERGRILSVYAVVFGVASILSQVFVVLYSGDTTNAFIAMAGLFSLAIVVLAPTRTVPPDVKKIGRLRILDAYRDSPTATVGVFANGFLLALLLNVVPYQASVAGLSANLIAFMVGSFYLGRTLLQVPLGNASDRLDRRAVIVAVSAIASLVLFGLSIVSDGDGQTLTGAEGATVQIVVITASVLLGGLVMPLYSLLVAHAMDRTVPVYVSSTAVTLLFVFTLGSVGGPFVGGLVSALVGPTYLLWLCTAVMAAATLFSAARIWRRAPVARAEAAKRVAVTPTSVAMTPTAKRAS